MKKCMAVIATMAVVLLTLTACFGDDVVGS